MTSEATIKSRWSKLDVKRSGHLDRQRKCASFTIPALLPPLGATENDQLNTPFQSLGARGVNNLAAKLLMILLPPNSPFFRMVVGKNIEEELQAREDDRAVTRLEKQLASMERNIHRYIERLGARVPLYRMIRLLIVTGNALLYVPDDGRVKVYRLDQYVVVRDPKGDTLEIIIREEVSPVLLPPEIREEIASKQTNSGDPNEGEKPTELFTRIIRQPSKWEVIQEAGGVLLPDTYSTYPIDECPWIALRWADVDGEHYGRGLVDEILGDLASLDSLTEAIVEGSAAAAKILFLVNPAGLTDWRDLAETPNLGFVPGRAEDVNVLQLLKHADFQVAHTTAGKLEERLSQAFLLNSSIQRQAERVTAEEIRYMAQELEDALGGVYSMLAQEFQIPFVRRCMTNMRKKKELPPLPKKSVEPVIVTGLDALGRGHDLRKLEAFMSLISPLGPEVIQQKLNVSDYIDRVGTGLGMDTTGLVIPEEAQGAGQMQAMMQQLLAQVGPDVIKQITGGAVDMAVAQNTPQTPTQG